MVAVAGRFVITGRWWGIVYRHRTGSAWRDLPAVFGPWQTAWKRHRRFALDGTWDRLLAEVVAEADAAGELDWTLSVDSTVARVHARRDRQSRLGAGLAHRGRQRMTRIRRPAALRRPITAWAGPAAG